MKVVTVIRSLAYADYFPEAMRCSRQWLTKNGYTLTETPTALLPVDLLSTKAGNTYTFQIVGTTSDVFKSRWKRLISKSLHEDTRTDIAAALKELNLKNPLTLVVLFSKSRATLYLHKGIITSGYTIDGEKVASYKLNSMTWQAKNMVNPDDLYKLMFNDKVLVTKALGEENGRQITMG